MLELVNIKKVFNLSGNKEDERVALDHINLKIEDGDFITVIGGNGSGKTTTLNVIAGAIIQDEGDVILDGENINNLKEYQRAKYFSRVFQDPSMGTAGDMSILENLEIALLRGKKHSPFEWGFKKAHKQFFIEELERFDLGLENRLNQKVRLLSGGQRQALTLLMASLVRPKVLLLDEHTAALDPKTAEKVLNTTDRIVKENNLTTIMITHNMKDAIKHGNRLIMMSNGKIVVDIRGEEKAKLTVSDLLDLFNKASKNDTLSDSAILG